MEHTNLQFKTNIKCSGCIASVKPYLDKAAGIDQWDVDTLNKDKILTVQATGVTEKEIIETVQKAGFSIESL